MSCKKHFDAWLESLEEGWWDDAADAGEFLGSLEQAFNAGYAARGCHGLQPPDHPGIRPGRS